MHVEASETVGSDSTDLADCLQFIVPQLGLARPSSHLVLVQWASYCSTSKDDPERLGGVLRHPPDSDLEASRNPLSARVAIPLDPHLTAQLASAARDPAKIEQPSKKPWGVDIGQSAAGQGPTSPRPRRGERSTADENTTRHASVLLKPRGCKRQRSRRLSTRRASSYRRPGKEDPRNV